MVTHGCTQLVIRSFTVLTDCIFSCMYLVTRSAMAVNLVHLYYIVPSSVYAACFAKKNFASCKRLYEGL